MFSVKVVFDPYSGKKNDSDSDNPLIAGYLQNEFKDENIAFETASISKTQHKVGSIVIYQNEKYITILRTYMSTLLDTLFDFSLLHQQVYEMLKNNDKVLLIVEADERGIYGEESSIVLKLTGFDLGYPVRVLPSAKLNKEYNTKLYLKYLIKKLLKTDLDELYMKSKPIFLKDEDPYVDFLMRAEGYGYTLVKRLKEEFPSIIDLLAIRNGKIVMVDNWNKKVKGIGKDKKENLEKMIFKGKKQKQHSILRFLEDG